MPPKKTFNRDDSDDDDDSVETSTSEDEVPAPKRGGAPPAAAANGQGRGVANKPHDEEFDAGDAGGQVSTPPENSLRKPPPSSTTQATITPAAKNGSGTMLRNNPNDETFDVEDDRPVNTPPRGSSNVSGGGAGGGAKPAAATSNAPGPKTGLMRNNPNDEFEDVDDDVETPPRQQQQRQQQQSQSQAQAQANNRKPGELSTQAVGAKHIRNDHHDEAIDVSDHSGSPSSTYGSTTPQSTQKAPPPAPTTKQPLQAMTAIPQGGKMSMLHAEESSSEDDEEHGPGGAGGAKAAGGASKPPPTQEYNPADYASINQRASREMQELFMTIASYQAVIQELPSKLRPFIPDFIPSVGDLDPFCKIPRPDGRPDNLGLTMIDEPCANQSNPAVVKIGLQYITRGHIPSVFVDCVEDAANRPNVIDKWVADIKKLHYKKPLPTVNYSKPMPEIESLLQVWAPEFEELLNSDLQFPPTQVDLDIDQYVRVMCAILDIPTYGSLIESLHVMFTLYCEFRANQHFQHA